MDVLSENVKRDKQIFLQKVKPEAGVGALFEIVQVIVLKVPKFSGAFLDKDNRVDLFDLEITELLFLRVADPFVLAQQKVS